MESEAIKVIPLILHLLFEEKFGEYAVKQFSDKEMSSEFVVIVFKKRSPFSISSDTVTTIRHASVEFEELLRRLGDYKAIVLHGLFYSWQERVLRAVPPGVKVAWAFWGGEIYGRKDLCRNYLSLSSRRLLEFQRLRRIISHKKEVNSYEMPISLLRRIDYCLTDVHEDYVFVKEYLKSEIKELWYNYYSIEETLGELANARITGNDILVGNSCSLECNHLLGFRLLRRLSLGDSKVIVPLSYGENWLKNKLLTIGRVQFGNRFMPILDFIPRTEYNRIIQRCSAVVMPHYRPQAFGNIVTALWLGSRVFLSERNVLYSHFKRIGAIVFSIETDLKKTNPLVLFPLTESERSQNRKAIKAFYSKDVMYQKNLELVRILNQ